MNKINLLKLQSVLILFFLGLSWGAGYTIAHYVTLHGISSVTFSFYLAMGPALLLCLFAWARGLSLGFSWVYWRYYIIAGIFGVVVPNTSMYIAAPHLPAGALAMMVNITPIIIYPLALIAGQEQFKWVRFLGVLCGIAGILLMTLPAANLHTAHASHWILIVLLSPMSFAFSTVYIAKYRPSGSDSVSLSAGMLLVSAVLLIPIVLFLGRTSIHFSITHFVDGLIILQIVLSSVGTVALFYLIKIAGPVYFSLVSGLVVLAGVFWGRVFFSEQLSTVTFLSLILILLAILLVTLAHWRRQNPRTSQQF